MTNDYKICWRCQISKPSQEFIADSDYECVQCRQNQATEDAPSLAIVAAQAVWPKKVASKGERR